MSSTIQPSALTPPADRGQVHWLANFVWGIADDVLRDLYVRGKYYNTQL
jgi:hypothetical protein